MCQKKCHMSMRIFNTQIKMQFISYTLLVLPLLTGTKLLHHHIVLRAFMIQKIGHISVMIGWFQGTCAPKLTFYSLSVSAKQIKIRCQLGVPPLTCIWWAANIIFTAVIITTGSNQPIWLLTADCTGIQCLLHLAGAVLKNTVCHRGYWKGTLDTLLECDVWFIVSALL